VAIDMIGEERSNHLVVEVLGVDVTALHSSAQVTQRPERTRHASVSRLVAQLKQPCAVAVHVRTQPPRPPARSRHDRSSRSKRAVPNPSEVIRRAAKLCRPSPMRPRRRAAPGFERTTTINLVRRHGRSGHQPAVFTPIACQCRRHADEHCAAHSAYSTCRESFAGAVPPRIARARARAGALAAYPRRLCGCLGRLLPWRDSGELCRW